MLEDPIKTSKKNLKHVDQQVWFHSFFSNLYSQEFGNIFIVVELIQLI